MKKIITTSVILLFIFSTIGYWIAFSGNFYTDNSQKPTFFYIDQNTTIDKVRDNLLEKGYLKNNISFWLMSNIYKPQDSVKAGAYLITQELSNTKFLHKIYHGYQTPVKLKINNIRLKDELVSKVCAQTNIDSIELIGILNNNSDLEEYSININNCLTIFIPDTYEVYWTITPKEFIKKMHKEYKKFWTDERIQKSRQIPLSPTEVSILASIVEEESNKTKEKPIIAGLYINRLRIGMKLQADPTAKYAFGNFGVDKILTSYTQIDSPYNTYKYKGLPPGPIRIPSIESIDAVLDYRKHKYIYMCAKPELNGEHNFAESYNQHLLFANQYYKAFKEWKERKTKN